MILNFSKKEKEFIKLLVKIFGARFIFIDGIKYRIPED